MGRVTSEEWRGRLDRFQGAKISVGRFCRRERVSVSAFYRWRTKLEAEADWRAATASDTVTGRLPVAKQSTVEAKTPAKASLSAAFAAVRVVGLANEGRSASVVVLLPGGIRVEIPMGDLQALEAALQIVVQTVVKTDASRGGGGAC